MLASLRFLLLASLTASVVAPACGSPIGVNENCAVIYHGMWGASGDCSAGATCVNTLHDNWVCRVVQPCHVDSDCPGDFGCLPLAIDGTYHCSTSCNDDGTSWGCAAGAACTLAGTCEARTGKRSLVAR